MSLRLRFSDADTYRVTDLPSVSLAGWISCGKYGSQRSPGPRPRWAQPRDNQHLTQVRQPHAGTVLSLQVGDAQPAVPIAARAADLEHRKTEIAQSEGHVQTLWDGSGAEPTRWPAEVHCRRGAHATA
jgi:hypothetical protein